jgi:hypothetical protein
MCCYFSFSGECRFPRLRNLTVSVCYQGKAIEAMLPQSLLGRFDQALLRDLFGKGAEFGYLVASAGDSALQAGRFFVEFFEGHGVLSVIAPACGQRCSLD